VLLPGLPSDERRAADGLSTIAMRKFWLVLSAPTPVGVNFQVTLSASPAPVRETGDASGVK
jgi:hypothetical protein